MNLSVQLLRENGTKEWSLPSFDKRTYDNNHSDDDTSDDDTSDSRGSNNDSALEILCSNHRQWRRVELEVEAQGALYT